LARAIWHFIDDRAPIVSDFEEVLDKFRPDVFHSNVLPGLTVGLWSKAKARGIPIVHTLHDYYLICARSLRFSDGDRCKKTCLSCSVLTSRRRRAARLIDTVVSVSDRTLTVHSENGVFTDGIKNVVIRNPPPSIEAKVASIDAVGRPLVFGFLGRSCAEKGTFELAAAFRDIPAAEARLVIAGHIDETTRARVVQEAGTGKVAFLGFVSPETFFRQIDVMVLPSLWEEPSPMTIGESFAYARPVVGSRRGGIPELLNDDCTGWLFEPGEGNLSALLKELVADKPGVMTKSRFLSGETKRRSFDDLVSEYLAVYKNTIERSRVATRSGC
jgi:glycosyltransferase involved in cell wall biosynthesis